MIDVREFDRIIVDAYGVFYFGKGVSGAVLETFKDWIRQGKEVYVLSNATYVNEKTIDAYTKKGVIKGVHYTDILTSGQFTFEDVKKGNLAVCGRKFYVFGTANFKSDNPVPTVFSNSSYELVEDVKDADFVYCGVPQLVGKDGGKYDSEEIEDFILEVRKLVKRGIPLVCANPDKVANEGGRFVVRQGMIADVWEEEGGEVIMYGKPDVRIFEALIERYCPEVERKKILMIGDTLRTDIKGAKLAGIKGALVLEGGVSEYEMKKLGLSLEEYILREGVEPDFVYDRVSKDLLF